MSDAVERARRTVAAAADRHPGVVLMVLYGSRARGDARPDSDWDFAYLGQPLVDALQLRLDLADGLRSDAIDLVDLERAGALLRYRVARDGIPLFERVPDAFARFWLDAVRFWCDVAPLVRAGYDATLAELAR